MKDRITFILIVSTLFIKEIWTLIPMDTQELKMFPFSETMITKPTYVWFVCYYGIQLIVVHSWYSKFAEYRTIFGAWFLLQCVEFVEFFFSYNEAIIWFYVGPYKIDINVINIKYLVVISLTARHFIWKK